MTTNLLIKSLKLFISFTTALALLAILIALYAEITGDFPAILEVNLISESSTQAPPEYEENNERKSLFIDFASSVASMLAVIIALFGIIYTALYMMIKDSIKEYFTKEKEKIDKIHNENLKSFEKLKEENKKEIQKTIVTKFDSVIGSSNAKNFIRIGLDYYLLISKDETSTHDEIEKNYRFEERIYHLKLAITFTIHGINSATFLESHPDRTLILALAYTNTEYYLAMIIYSIDKSEKKIPNDIYLSQLKTMHDKSTTYIDSLVKEHYFDDLIKWWKIKESHLFASFILQFHTFKDQEDNSQLVDKLSKRYIGFIDEMRQYYYINEKWMDMIDKNWKALIGFYSNE